MSLPTVLAVALPAAPGVAGLSGLLLRGGARRAAAALGIGGSAVALVAAVLLAADGSRVEGDVRLADLGDIAVRVGIRVDPTASAVAVAVGLVALLVQVYSVAYLADDDRYAPYAAQISLFTAAMFTVVTAADLVQLLVGWEVMGICSYLLIGHDRRLPAAPAAAVKAFLVTRVGDVGFWLGVILLGTGAGSFRIDAILSAAEHGTISSGRVTVACLLLLAGVAGKSAQFPLHTWLPDAMAGPTPISALIHAATMVAAGVYLVDRLYPLFAQHPPGGVPVPLVVLGVLAAITMLLGALAATAQDDIKRVLAYSTISQLAYMLGALAVGGDRAAVYHLLTHAAFKALLFLAAGSVIHAAGTNLMSRMGGLRRGMPITFWTMTLGLAALAGVPPLAGFWSKDSVLGAAQHAAEGSAAAPRWLGALILFCGLGTVAITGWYATRLWLRTFFGAPRSAARAHDPRPAMWVPLVVLAVPTVALGFLSPSRGLGLVPMLVGLLLTALGVFGASVAWRRDPAADPARLLGRLRPAFAAAFWLDAVQRAVVVRPVLALAGAVRRGDETLVDGAVEATGTGATGLARRLVRLHTGLPRYLTAVVGGAALLGVLAVILEAR